MKIKEVLIEFSDLQQTLLKINQVVPHMAAAGLPLDVANVAKFTNSPTDATADALKQYLRNVDPVSQAGGLPKVVHAVIAVAFMLKNNRLSQSKISHQMLEQLSGVDYDVLFAAAEQYLPEIQKNVTSFRLTWLQPIAKRLWKNIPQDQQKQLIVREFNKLLNSGARTVSARDVAMALSRSGEVLVKDVDSLRKAIDVFLSSDDPDAKKLNLYRPIGRGGSTGGIGPDYGGIKTW